MTAIDRDAKRLTVADGSELDYDALVLATGSYPFVPPVPGKDSAGCHVYRTLDDLDAIRTDAEAALACDPEPSALSSVAGCSAWRPPTRCGCSEYGRTWSNSRLA